MLYVSEDRSSRMKMEDGSSIVAYVVMLVLLVAVVAIIVGIALAVIRSVGVETLGGRVLSPGGPRRLTGPSVWLAQVRQNQRR